jgi:hypothetical protein
VLSSGEGIAAFKNELLRQLAGNLDVNNIEIVVDTRPGPQSDVPMP